MTPEPRPSCRKCGKPFDGGVVAADLCLRKLGYLLCRACMLDTRIITKPAKQKEKEHE